MDMKFISVRVLAAVLILSTTFSPKVTGQIAEGVTPKYEREGNYDWKKNMIIADRKRDAAGMLLPLHSYDKTICSGMSFLLENQLKWFKGPGESLIDEKGQTQMPWVYYSILQHDDFRFDMLRGSSPLLDAGSMGPVKLFIVENEL